MLRWSIDRSRLDGIGTFLIIDSRTGHALPLYAWTMAAPI